MIEAEDYDTGGEGVAYHETEAGNSGHVYRDGDVDIQGTNDGGRGYGISWFQAGEWLQYTVNVTAPGTYGISARVASAEAEKSFRIEFDGADVTGAINVPNTGGWHSWRTVSANAVTLTAGVRKMRIVAVTGGVNINSVTLTASASAPPSATTAAGDRPASGTRTGRFTLRFDERSPLTRPEVFHPRMRFEDRLAGVEPDQRAGLLKRCQYDMRKESFEVYVPQAYDPARPCGLMVYIPTSSSGAPPDEWLPVFERLNMIWVSANNHAAGGYSHLMQAFALEGAYHISRTYSVNPDRTYIGGWHAGLKLAVFYQEVFRGMLMVDSFAYWAIRPPARSASRPPPERLMATARERSSFVLLSADTDTLWGRGNYIYEDGFKKDGFRNVELIKMPYTRITVPGAIWFERGIESLDKALVPEAEAAFTVASKLVRKGERARALDALEGACHPGIRAPAAEHACTLQAVLLRERDECLANARDVEARGDPLKALSLYRDLLTRYGPKYALGAVESLARLQARPEIRAKITAAEADRLKRRSEEKARAEEERRRRVPATALRLARNFINNGRNDLARKKLEDVVAKYPDTDEAREAKKLLGRIKGR